MSAEVQGLLTFVSNGMPALMMDRVAAMVAELEALGVKPTITVTVELGSTRQSFSGAITAETGTSAPAAPGTSTATESMRRSTGKRSMTSDGERGEAVSAASMSAGEDFLGGARGEGREEGENGQRSMVDWGVTGLSAGASQSQLMLDAGATTWRKVPKWARLELVQAVLAQPTESGRPMTTGQFDQVRPAWMSKAGNLINMFGCAWSELPGLRLSE